MAARASFIRENHLNKHFKSLHILYIFGTLGVLFVYNFLCYFAEMRTINQIEPWFTGRESRLVGEYLRSGGWLAEFGKTQEFEKQFADAIGAEYAVATNNGTVALTLCLMALGIGKGDEVIVPDYTMIATPNSVLLAGAKPVFADIEPKTLCLDADKLPITKKTRAIIHVSINGRGGDIVKLRNICKDRNIHLIEDSCQSFTSKHKGKFLGTFGEMGCFSLTFHKIITTGNGGVIVTNDKNLYNKIGGLKNFGRSKGGEDRHETIGYNFKFSDLQAVIGLAQMSNLAERVKRKKALYKFYQDNLTGVPGIEFLKIDLKETTPLFADILVPAKMRPKLINYLRQNNIDSRAFYPSITTQPAYRGYTKAKFPVSRELSQRGLWLPSSLTLKESELEYICNKIKKFF